MWPWRFWNGGDGGCALLPAAAARVYTLARLCVDAGRGRIPAFLPAIFLAAAPLLRAVWFPDAPEAAAFSFALRAFFVLFNAAIGVLFPLRANRELFD